MKKKSRKLLSKSTVWKYDNGIIIHTCTNLPEQEIYFSNGIDNVNIWEEGEWVDIGSPNPPKGKFITIFKDRIGKFFRLPIKKQNDKI